MQDFANTSLSADAGIRRVQQFESPAAVPTLSTQQLVTAEGELNAELNHFMFDPPSDPALLKGKRIAICCTNGVEEIEVLGARRWLTEQMLPRPHDTAGGEALVCPGCSAAMDTLVVPAQQSFLVDLCPRCSGFWLDNKSMNSGAPASRARPETRTSSPADARRDRLSSHIPRLSSTARDASLPAATMATRRGSSRSRAA